MFQSSRGILSVSMLDLMGLTTKIEQGMIKIPMEASTFAKLKKNRLYKTVQQ